MGVAQTVQQGHNLLGCVLAGGDIGADVYRRILDGDRAGAIRCGDVKDMHKAVAVPRPQAIGV